jgi:DNA helicase-2/ATP-dependent DNA helicase PcrA
MNFLTLAAAGSGKTTYLVNKALEIKDSQVLITTFTTANEQEIRNRFIEINGLIPPNVHIQTWFSFCIQHGVKPFQSYVYEGRISGMLLVNTKSGYKTSYNGRPIYWGEDKPDKHYISKNKKIFSDKISKFVCKADKLSGGSVIDRIIKVFPTIFVDEVQDMSGYDLEILKLLLRKSNDLHLVGDPRQVTYSTHNEAKYNKYKNGLIHDFIIAECKSSLKKLTVDTVTLKNSYRNNQEVCNLAGSLYPYLVKADSISRHFVEGDGVYIVTPASKETFMSSKEGVVQLRLDKTNNNTEPEYPAYNFGESKGLTFENTIIYPTKGMIEWLINHSSKLEMKTRSQMYVALTRSKHSVGIFISDEKDLEKLTSYKNYDS